MDTLILFQYNDNKSIIHHIHPVTKIIIYLIISLTIFFSNIINLLIIFIFLLLLFFLSKNNIINSLKKGKNILFFILFIFFIGILDFSKTNSFYINIQNLKTQSIFIFKLIISFLLSELFLFITKIQDIYDFITIITRKIPLLKKIDAGLYLCLTIKFISLIFYEYTKIKEAFIIRSGNSIKNPVKKIYYIVIPLIIIMIKKSFDISDTLIIKYNNIDRTIYFEKLLICDYLIIFVFIIYFILNIFFILY